jgi:hypothetical protein
MLPLCITMDNDEIKGVVDTKNCFESLSHLPPWRGIESSEVRCNHVDLAPMAACDAGDMLTKRFVGGTIGQKERTGRQAAVREIWRSGGVVR